MAHSKGGKVYSEKKVPWQLYITKIQAKTDIVVQSCDLSTEEGLGAGEAEMQHHSLLYKKLVGPYETMSQTITSSKIEFWWLERWFSS